MVYGPYSVPRDLSTTPGAEFRNLSHLHVQGCFNSDLPRWNLPFVTPPPHWGPTPPRDNTILQTITTSVPQLTHLSLHTNLPIEWEQLMREVETNLPPQDSRYGMSPRVQRIFVRRVDYVAYMRSTELLARVAASNTRGKLVIRDDTDQVNRRSPRRLWLNQITGECALWTDSGERRVNEGQE
ncbi:hypothetical protein NEOLEDRAFT_1182708 [Neolentinus lepideus HHB14362 ss-1]|uniref:Uncharacterized protein n=1 Tax=Neolentinus lepideus HHB14362 ss-1 TaxID=1314782 RepID=A0A165NW03_9AGAM|nr:hypothetical protein NEOLEDRAFT_1182708 [Neolentinus lepideus HHB14362 ss-1]